MVAYARRWPEYCREVDDDGWDCKTFEIDKGRFCFRLTATYNEERWEAGEEVCKGRQYRREVKMSKVSDTLQFSVED